MLGCCGLFYLGRFIGMVWSYFGDLLSCVSFLLMDAFFEVINIK